MENIAIILVGISAGYVGWILVLCRRALSKYLED